MKLMKLKFSPITIGFTSAGFLIAVLSVMLSVVYGFAGPALQTALSETEDLLVFFCPASFASISFDHAATSDYIFLYAIELISNTILYFLLGLLFSWAWRWLSRLEIK